MTNPASTPMYRNYFGLAETPFSIAPDPRYLYMSQRHREALAHLLYGVSREGGFVLLTGEVGTGKTTVCRCFLEQLPENCDAAIVFNPKLSAEELLSTICEEFRIPCPEGNTSIKLFIDRINAYLLDGNARGRNTVLIIDEAQNLGVDVLEQIRLLTNLETHQRKLLQIVLIGQPQLRDMLARPELRQLAQRIIARYHLGPLSKEEVAAYVSHRLAVAGVRRQLFPPSTVAQLYRLSGGIPRLINVLCDRALLGAYVQGKERIGRSTIARAAREVFGDSGLRHRHGTPRAILAGAGALFSAVAVAAYFYYGDPSAAGIATPPAAPITQPIEARPAVAEASKSAPPQALPGPAAENAPLDAVPRQPGQPRGLSEGLAFQALFKQWGIAVGPEAAGNACGRADAAGLRCLSERGGLDDLRRLDRPAVLHLRDDRGEEFLVTLTALRGETATVVVGGETKVVYLKALASQWSGGYTLLWRAPPEYRDVIRLGSRGPAVEWLQDRLALLPGAETTAQKHPTFDLAVAERVKRFQLAEGLLPDGVVGPQTLIRLDTAIDGGSPKLSERRMER